jgi:amino acid adenylation domain-containing protein
VAALWCELLGVAQVGRHDDFFALGGHSLLALRLVSRLRETLGVELPLQAVFGHPTLAGLAQATGDAGRDIGAPIVQAARGALHPLSWAQQRLWFIAQFDPAVGAVYNLPLALRLEGRIDEDALRRTFDRIVARHDVLRTRFRVVGGEPVQCIEAAEACDFVVHDLAALVDAERGEAVARLSRESATAPFDFAVDAPLRVALLRLAPAEHLLLVTQHHIASDGWSTGVLTREVTALYAAFSAGRADPLPPLALQYADYAAWQRATLQGEALQAHLDYWKTRLAGAPQLIDLPLDRPRPTQQSHVGAKVYFSLSSGLGRELAALGRRQGATLFMTLLTAWAILLARMGRQDEVVIGTAVANRQRREVEDLIGFFANTLALRVAVDSASGAEDLLAHVRTHTLEAYAHQEVPFEQVVEALQPQRSMSYAPLFQTMLTLNNTPAGGSSPLPGLTLHSVELAHEKAPHDLALALEENDGELRGSIEYATALFDRATIERMVVHFEVLCAAMAAEPRRAVGTLAMLSPAQRRQLLVGFNGTDAPWPQERCVHELFEQQAALTPSGVAVIEGARRVTYAALDARANQIAHELRARGVEVGHAVGLCMHRGVEMVAALLAVLKCGAAHVALDPGYPAARQAFILEDSRADLVLTQVDLTLPESLAERRVVRLDAADVRARLDAWPATPPAAGGRALTPHDSAYVLYTSGSTGRPKGVDVPHRCVVNYLHYARKVLLPGVPGAVVTSPLAFDATVTTLLGPLVCGKWTRLLSDGQELEQMAGLWCAAEPVLFSITPAHLDALACMLPDRPATQARHVVLLGGEQLSTNAARTCMTRLAPKAVLINEYGPTETVVGCTRHVIERADRIDLAQPAIPIGVPIDNTQMFVVDPAGDLAPLGVPGELLIGGAGVARGYLNLPELTAERFIANPFQAECAPGCGERLYRTGDLVRWLANGELEFLGRLDDQVKLRGLRIELGEIEACIAKEQGVAGCIVLAREHAPGDKRLVAYVAAAAPDAQALAARLRTRLKASLPPYMVPAHVVVLDALPLTSNNKVDRKALPAPASFATDDGPWEAPRGAQEAAVAAVWQELLGCAPVGRNDDFFELGGHSLLAVQMVARLRQALRVDAPLRVLFSRPRLADYVAALDDLATLAPARSHLVAMREEGAQAPLFLVHAVDGESGYARELAKWLDADRPVYGLTASGFLSGETAGRNVEAIASGYVADLRKVQPAGPYRLAGWSLGGTIAYEMALQLIGAGEQVAFLGLIDTRHGYSRLPASGDAQRDRALFLLDSLPDAVEQSQHERLSALANTGDVAGMLAHCRAIGLFPQDLKVEDLERHLDVRHGLSIAVGDYVPAPLAVPVAYFCARDEQRADPTLGWASVLGDRLHLRTVPGSHYSVVAAPNAQLLAREMEALLEASAMPAAGGDEQRHAPRITIQGGRAGAAPVFCVPGAGASVTAFTHLAQALGPDIPLHGLQPRGLCGELMPYVDVASAARAYGEAIRQLAPHGPYHLVGHSYGGWVATEIARQLTEQGLPPASLIALDSNAPTLARTPQQFHTREEILSKLVSLFELRLPQPLGIARAQLDGLAPDEQLKLLRSRLVEANLLPPRTNLQALRGIVHVFGRNLNADYKPAAPYAGRLHLAVAADSDTARTAHALAGWRAHAPQASVWHSAGNHLTMLAPPHAQALAAWMKSILLAARGEEALPH